MKFKNKLSMSVVVLSLLGASSLWASQNKVDKSPNSAGVGKKSDKEPGKNSDIKGPKKLEGRMEPVPGYAEVMSDWEWMSSQAAENLQAEQGDPDRGTNNDLPSYGEREEPKDFTLAVSQISALQELYQNNNQVRDYLVTGAWLSVAVAVAYKACTQSPKCAARILGRIVGGTVGLAVMTVGTAHAGYYEIPNYTEDPEDLLGGKMSAAEVVAMMEKSPELNDKMQMLMAATAEKACEVKDYDPFVKGFCTKINF